jgi:hypothetical protein
MFTSLLRTLPVVLLVSSGFALAQNTATPSPQTPLPPAADDQRTPGTSENDALHHDQNTGAEENRGETRSTRRHKKNKKNHKTDTSDQIPSDETR